MNCAAFVTVALYLFARIVNTSFRSISPTLTTNGSDHTRNSSITTLSSTALRTHATFNTRRNEDYNCARDSGGNAFRCDNKTDRCTNTVVGGQQSYNAYVLCSNAAKTSQTAQTAAVDLWNENEPCPQSTVCCSGKRSLAVTNLFVASIYTVTAFGCVQHPPLTAYYYPRKNVLDPPKFSASLGQIDGDSFHSTGAQAGIGVAVGIGAIAILIISTTFFLRWRKTRQNDAKPPQRQLSLPELPMQEDVFELGSKFWELIELPSRGDPQEVSSTELHELPSHWKPPELQPSRRSEESVE